MFVLGYFPTLLISTLIHTCTYTYRKGKSTDILFGPFQKELEIWRCKSFNKNKIELKSKTFRNLQTDTHMHIRRRERKKFKIGPFLFKVDGVEINDELCVGSIISIKSSSS